MQSAPETPLIEPGSGDLSVAELQAVVAGFQAQFVALEQQLQAQAALIEQRDIRIELLEEMLRLQRIRKFAASSEKSSYQIELFDEAETEAEIDALSDALPEPDEPVQATRPRRKKRQRGFPDSLSRERVELTLPDADKVGASRIFFAKVKEELHYIPAELKVLEYWQEKAVFAGEYGDDEVITAPRPKHPLGWYPASRWLWRLWPGVPKAVSYPHWLLGSCPASVCRGR